MAIRLCRGIFPLLFCTFLLVATPGYSAGPPSPIGNFGPTGIEVSVLPDHLLKVLDVQVGSPAEGKLKKGDIITAINGIPPVQSVEDPAEVFSTFKQLASFITKAEATDGILTLRVKPDAKVETEDVKIKIPVLGAYSPTWPVNCTKTDKIIRAEADYIASVAGENGEGLTEHNLYNGFAILMLLSTGEEQDLDVVRKVYKARMATFKGPDTGSNNWHNGVQGIAVCEYYLRTGDKSVMPLINAICEAARKYQVCGGWSHWAKGINPQYTAGGLMNAAGVQNLTTLLLAKECGAKVNEDTLNSALKFFYRFVGHGNTPYGDHRPEGGLTDNGKTAMVALAMNVASQAENGKIYAMARDKAALAALYNYPALLRGHTGANGAKWHGIAAALLADKKPRLYRNQLENKQWFFELSRRFNGAMGGCGTGRYDNENDGYFTGLTLTAPRKTLQITGAPRSPYAKTFRLPDRPWGRPADLAFFSLDGGAAYQELRYLPPHLELQAIANADAAALRRYASHPEHIYREQVASSIRDKGLYGLIEELLVSSDPLAQETACMAINQEEDWGLRFHIGTRSRYSIAPENYTPRMFAGVMAIITNPKSALWSVDQALASLAVASTDQVKSRLDDIIPWLKNDEWLLNESATIALTPAMKDEESIDKILPVLIPSMARNIHIKGRGVMSWMLSRGTVDAPQAVKEKVLKARIDLAKRFVSVPSPEAGVDLSGITSVALEEAIGGILRDDSWQIRDDPKVILQAAEIAVQRLDELRGRERTRLIDLLIQASDKLKDADKKALGNILVQHFRPTVVGDDPEALKRDMAAGQALGQMNTLLAIDHMAGRPGGWELLGSTGKGEQVWWHTSFEPKTKPADNEYNRYRAVDLPDRLKDWYTVDYDPAENGWTREQQVTAEGVTPKGYAVSKAWFAKYLPKAGEVVFVRKEFKLKDLDFAMMRLSVYSRQGYDVYLNGQRIAGTKGRSKTWQARRTYFNDKMKQSLKVGKNVIAVRSFLQYFRGLDGGIDVFVEKLDELPSVQ